MGSVMDSSADAALQQALQRLAEALRRPRTRLAAFAQLPPEQIDTLTQLINDACERDARQVHDDLRRVMPWSRWFRRAYAARATLSAPPASASSASSKAAS